MLTWRARAGAALSIGVALVVSPSAVKDTWIGVRTTHLTIVSSAGEGPTKRVAQRVERFVDAFSAFAGEQPDPDLPVTVMVFKNDTAFAPFSPRKDGRTMSLSAYFQRADDENLVALSVSSAVGGDAYRAICHEYAHALMARSGSLWPLWLQEGVAEFTSTFQSDSRRVAFGAAIPEHVNVLRGRRFPLNLLLSPDATPIGDGMLRGVYYAEAWAFVHYLYGGDGGTHRAALERFMGDLSGGRAPEAAFDEAFGTDRVGLSEALRRYITEGRYDLVNVAFDRPETKAPMAVRPVSEAEAEVLQGSLLMRVGRGDEAAPYFSRARALDPRAPRLEESLGFLALNRGRYDEAKAHLQQAIAHDPRNPLAHYYFAETLRREVMEQGQPLPADIARTMAVSLRTVIALRPSFARAHYLLGYAHSATGDDLAEGVRHLETAIRLQPPNRGAMLTLASMHSRMGNYAAAKATAQAIVDAPDAGASVKIEARSVLDSATRLLAAP